jgi:hypothetical protein
MPEESASMSSSARFLTSLLSVAALLATAPALAIDAGELRFRVLLDDREIGEHRFVISPDAAGKQVQSEARFDVRILGIPVYRYRHENLERWSEDGCLASISSRTTANGDRFEVEGQRDADTVFRLATAADEQALQEGCLMTFAYWDRSFLRQPRLLNSQTGELVDVSVERLPSGTPSRIANGRVLEGYRIVAEQGDTDIRVWYDAETDRWVGLESRVANDRLLAYVREED